MFINVFLQWKTIANLCLKELREIRKFYFSINIYIKLYYLTFSATLLNMKNKIVFINKNIQINLFRNINY